MLELVDTEKDRLRCELADAADAFAAARDDLERQEADRRVDVIAGLLASVVLGTDQGAEWEQHREWFAQGAIDRALS